ncbi:phosphoketolase [Rhizobium sp. BK538]|nr:phosphoketolase [Rhizobium sp. BK538]
MAANGTTLAASELRLIDRYWRAANYLSVGQIYLMDNPLLREPLKPEHIKPRLLGHWGTTPGLNFIYAHLNRIIKARDIDVLYVCGPGHGGPGMVANTYLEGTYSEVYPEVTQSASGMRKLFKQFSFPGGIPSHAAPETPGSIHEGGELGYALIHAFLRDRRRGSRNRTPSRSVALHQVPQSGPRRRSPAHSSPQRLQDR